MRTLIKCKTCGVERTEDTERCPICEKPPVGQPVGQPIRQGVGGGPKPKEKTCPKCGYYGFAKRNKSGRMCMCQKCNHRVF